MSLKERILEKAFLIACERGIGSISVSEIARRLQVSKGSVTAHFKTNEDLKIGACLRTKEEYWKEVVSKAQQAKPGANAIRTLFVSILSWIEKCEGFDPWIMSAAEFSSMSARLRDQVASTQQMIGLTIRQIIHSAINERELDEEMNIDRFIFEFTSAVLGFQLYVKWLKADHARKQALQSLNELLSRYASAKNRKSLSSVS